MTFCAEELPDLFIFLCFLAFSDLIVVLSIFKEHNQMLKVATFEIFGLTRNHVKRFY